MKTAAIALTMVLALVVGTAWSQPPQMIAYQGLLTDDTGAPVADGTYSLTFRIIDAETVGTELWSEIQASVAVSDGLFRVFLGSVTPLTLGFDIPCWLEVQVESETPQAPRIRLTSVPYSYTAMNADQVDGYDADATPTANTLLPLDASGQFPEEAIPSVPPGGAAGGDLTGTYPNPSIANDAVTGPKILAGAVNTSDLADDAVRSGKIEDGHVRTADLADGAVTVAKIAPDVVSSIDGVSNDGGNIDLVAGSNVSITPDDGTNTITIDAATGAGDITAVWAGHGLDGGGDSGDVSLNVDVPLELTGSYHGVVRGSFPSGTHGLIGASSYGVEGQNANGNWGALGGSSYGVLGQYGTSGPYGYLGAEDHAGWFVGDVYVLGSIDKSACSFLIDHPLEPENKLLRHNCVESPEHLLVYRGKVSVGATGDAQVQMPDYFGAVSNEEEASIHLTPAGRPFDTGAEWNPGFRSFTVYGDPGREVFWQVLAERDDPVIRQLARPVEEEKGPDNKYCDRGELLHPTAYGYPESMRPRSEEEEMMERYEQERPLRRESMESRRARMLETVDRPKE